MKSKAFDHSKYGAWIDPEAVTPYERNAKQHTDKQIRNIVNSINRFGWQQDTVITSDNVLVIGHGRQIHRMEKELRTYIRYQKQARIARERATAAEGKAV